MPNFDTSATRRESVRNAVNTLDLLLATYQAGKQAQLVMAAYQANTDPVLTAAINAIFTASERTELGAMLQDVNTLITRWETDHRGALGLTP
jgi:hypothetical protein